MKLCSLIKPFQEQMGNSISEYTNIIQVRGDGSITDRIIVNLYV